MPSIPNASDASDASGQLSAHASRNFIPENKLTRLDRVGVALIDKLGKLHLTWVTMQPPAEPEG